MMQRAVRGPGQLAHGNLGFREIGRPTVRSYFQYLGKNAGPDAPTLVLVHGISRRAAQLIFRFRDQADKHGLALVAPLYQKVIYGQYQQVIDPKGTRADLALLDILEAAGHELASRTDRVHLFGYSGGAQFAHRFALLYPDRVASMSLASAGWYTMPDARARYPYGLQTHPLIGGQFDLDAFLSIDRHLFVGEDDVLRDSSLRQSTELDLAQGRTRVDRARAWYAAMDEASSRTGCVPAHHSFNILPGVGHSFSGSARRSVDLPARALSRLSPSLRQQLQKGTIV